MSLGSKIISLSFVAALIALVVGGFRTWEFVTGGGGVEAPCAHVRADIPEGTRLTLSECRVDFNDRRLNKKPAFGGEWEFYAPFAYSNPGDGIFKFKLKLTQRDDIRLADALLTEKGAVPNDALARLLEERSAPRSIRGVLHWQKTFSGTDGIIEESEPPTLWSGPGMMAPGISLLLVFVFTTMRERKKNAASYEAYKNEIAAREIEAAASIQSAAPEGAALLDVSRMVWRIDWISKIGVIIPAVLLFFAIISVLYAETHSGSPPIVSVLLLSVELFVLGAVFVQLPFRRLPFWLPVGGLAWSIFNILKSWVMDEAAGKAELGSDLIACAVYAAIALAVHIFSTVKVPDLGLERINLINRPISIRPFPPLSMRALTSVLYFILGVFYTYIGAVLASLIFTFNYREGYIARLAETARELMYRGSQAARLRRRYASPAARSVLSRDTRSPVLLLRSFIDDDLPFEYTGVMDYFYRSDRTFEEVVTDQLWGFGPVIAIGQPGEAVPRSGAVREYVSHDEWQHLVEKLVGQASLILMILGPTPGFGWELQRMVRLNCLDKVVLVMPPLSDLEVKRRWGVLVSEMGLSDKAAEFASVARVPGGICIVENGPRLVVLRSNKRDFNDYGVSIDLAARSIRSNRLRRTGTGPSKDGSPSFPVNDTKAP
ncbi:membrane hypothetical protein [Candidatus Terasakiella magnetica]|nr:membrane hypothetical protein [Candidatus Terasakiella magnetica]